MSTPIPDPILVEIQKILTSTPMLKIVMRMPNAKGDKWEEILMPWQTYQLLPSDKTLQAIYQLVLDEKLKLIEEVIDEQENSQDWERENPGYSATMVTIDTLIAKRATLEKLRKPII